MRAGRGGIRLLACCILCLLCAFTASGQQRVQTVLSEVGIDQRLGDAIPLDLAFRNEAGEAVRLGDYLGEKPAILSLVYYECPMLCTQILNGLLASLRVLSFDVGSEFEVITVSFDPEETADLAREKKESYVGRYGRKGAASGWHFLTGDSASIEALTRAVGFRYVYDPGSELFAHASGVMVLTPEGRLSRYFYGIEYAPRDLRLGLIEASANEIGTAVDEVLLYCFRYDPSSGKYSLVIMNVVRLAGIATVGLLGGFVFIMLRRERRQSGGPVGAA